MQAAPSADPSRRAQAAGEAAPRPIRFFHRGRVVEVEGLAPTLTVLDWLREHQRCTGTKEGCAEGDCGACTVIVAELADAGAAPLAGEPFIPGAAGVVGGLGLRAVNACMQFLPTLDGKALLTVEDLRPRSGALHPVQQAMVECHGSQCGFCTPGFVMSLAACYERHREAGTQPGRQALADELSGNLCRCTGYRPILDAGQRMFELPEVRLDTAPVVAALRALRAAPALHYRGPNPAFADAAASGRPGAGDAGDGSDRTRDGHDEGGGFAAPAHRPAPRLDRFDAPRSLEALAALLEARPQSRLLAGCTDIGLWVNKQFRDLGDIVYLGEVAELKQLRREAHTLHIGAAVPLEDAWRALAAQRPALREVWLRFASPPIRHAGTLGGNIANGSPIGDGAPVLMALGCQLLLRRGARRRRVALDGFYVDYMKNRLEPGEFIEALEVDLPGPATVLRAYKLAKRFDSDISAVCAGLALSLDEAGTVLDARLAFGGMAAVVRRAAQAEAALRGRPWSEAGAQAAAAALVADFTPLSDLRASAGYRLRAAQNLLRRFWLETRPHAPLPAAQTSVWAAMTSPPPADSGAAPARTDATP